MSCEACYASHAKCDMKVQRSDAAAAPGAADAVKVKAEEDANADLPAAQLQQAAETEAEPRPAGTACSRCDRMGLMCIPRVIKKRGRPRSGVTKTLEQAKARKRSGLVDLDSWTTCQAFYPQRDSLEQYQAAAALAALANKNDTPPRSLYWYTRMMISMASVERSMPLLHAATTLAVSVGFSDMASMFLPSRKPKSPTLSAGCVAKLQQSAALFACDKQASAEDSFSCCYMVKIVDGARTAVAGPNWARMFNTVDEMHNDTPGSWKYWINWIRTDEDRKRFTTSCLTNFLNAPVHVTEDGVEEYYTHEGTIESLSVHDRHGNHLLVDLKQLDVSVVCGQPRHVHVVRFGNIRSAHGEPLLPATMPPQAARASARTASGGAGTHGSRSRDLHEWPEALPDPQSDELMAAFTTVYKETIGQQHQAAQQEQQQVQQQRQQRGQQQQQQQQQLQQLQQQQVHQAHQAHEQLHLPMLHEHGQQHVHEQQLPNQQVRGLDDSPEQAPGPYR